jgi:hypothetical protein
MMSQGLESAAIGAAARVADALTRMGHQWMVEIGYRELWARPWDGGGSALRESVPVIMVGLPGGREATSRRMRRALALAAASIKGPSLSVCYFNSSREAVRHD